jgi:formylglycine-generating enzyme required for sulfatase activity
VKLRLAVLLGCTTLAAAAPCAVAAQRAEMVRIPGGTFRPLYAQPGEEIVAVASFDLDALPVTRRDFEAFVREHERWQPGRVPALFADADYLADWAGATSAGDATSGDLPVTDVSWFAARAYCEARGARLPTTSEWEYAARSDEADPAAATQAAFRQRALDFALAPRRDLQPVGSGMRSVWGASDLHGGVSEWVLDFNTIFGASDSRATTKRDRNLTCAAGATATGDSGDYAAFLRYALRASVDARSTAPRLGFRCARSAS